MEKEQQKYNVFSPSVEAKRASMQSALRRYFYALRFRLVQARESTFEARKLGLQRMPDRTVHSIGRNEQVILHLRMTACVSGDQQMMNQIQGATAAEQRTTPSRPMPKGMVIDALRCLGALYLTSLAGLEGSGSGSS